MCSRNPKEAFPIASMTLGETPRKSRMRGKVTCVRRVRKSHMRWPRKVTIMPTTMPWRTLKLEMAFLAFVLTGFWPVMRMSVCSTVSSTLGSLRPWDKPTDTTTFVTFGTALGLVMPSSFLSAGTTSFW